MNLNFTKDDQAFREEVRDWLNGNAPKERRPRDGAEQKPFDRAWQRCQYDAGWAGIAWPKEYGGRGLSLTQQLIWYEEYARAEAPSSISTTYVGLNHAGPTLIEVGTETQKGFHLPRILRGETAWCQGFSEPGSGSDLGSLRTSGVIEGDHMVVNGQKIWTTFADSADYQELLVRTGKGEKKHWGITWIIGQMDLPGIDIRPIRTMVGHHHFCEVFYDNVRIPLSNIVGELQQGWSVAMATLGFERGTANIAHQIELAHFLEKLIALSKETTGSQGKTLYQQDDVRIRLGELRAELAGLRALTYASVSRAAREAVPGAEGSIVRLYHTELLKRVSRFAIDILGVAAFHRLAHGSIVDEYLEAFSSTIAGGTAEIQRNVIGERVLGLPRV
jgi:alkylation response protein AidB-like acyl-CoA dehydrogenase